MKKMIISVVVVVLLAVLAVPAAAVDVVLRDGTVLQAKSYTMNGSWVMITLENGATIAYSVEDVNMEALQASAEEQEQAQEEPEPEQEKSLGGHGTGLGTGFGGAVAASAEGEAALTVTDQDVSHVRTRPGGEEGEEGEEEEGEEEEGEAEGDSSGTVSLQGIRVIPMGDGEFQVKGRVSNGSGTKVLDVRAVLTIVIGSDQQQADVSVAGSLSKGASAEFTHSFSADTSATPRVAAKLMWMAPSAPISPPSGG